MTTPNDPSGTMPDPDSTPGLEPGGGVAPGDTPPGEGSMSGAVGSTVNQGPVSGSRTPMIVAQVALGLVVLLIAALIAVRAAT